MQSGMNIFYKIYLCLYLQSIVFFNGILKSNSANACYFLYVLSIFFFGREVEKINTTMVPKLSGTSN